MLGSFIREDRLEQSHNSDTTFYLDNRSYYLEQLRREHAQAHRDAKAQGTPSSTWAKTKALPDHASRWLRVTS